jgi:glucosamine--fructose-6-phosphate aminotransferase (isomerizing)
MTSATPFESDIAEQPDALLRLAASDLPELGDLVARRWDRIVFTGMGSSDYASVPTWRRLIAAGLPTWSIDTSQLLDNPDLITAGTLLIGTSQSGASGEMVELLERRAAGAVRPGFLVGIADDADSPLAQNAELFLPLHSGPEATVSTKSYLNTLAVHRLLVGAFAGEDVDSVRAEISDAAETVRTVLRDVDVSATAAAAAGHQARRLAYVGRCDEAATAQFAGLITKESSKVPAEGFVGGQFRHGPYELAGDGLTAVIFGLRRDAPDESLLRLSEDLLATGSRVVIVGDYELEGAVLVPVSGSTDLSWLAASSVVAELFAVGLARANGVVPGKFLYGSKITTAV